MTTDGPSGHGEYRLPRGVVAQSEALTLPGDTTVAYAQQMSAALQEFVAQILNGNRQVYLANDGALIRRLAAAAERYVFEGPDHARLATGMAQLMNLPAIRTAGILPDCRHHMYTNVLTDPDRPTSALYVTYDADRFPRDSFDPSMEGQRWIGALNTEFANQRRDVQMPTLGDF